MNKHLLNITGPNIQVAEAHKAARERVDAFFENTEMRERGTAPQGVEMIAIGNSNTRYKFTNNAIYLLIYNGRDGDMRALNNEGGYISYRYPYDSTIVDDILFLSQPWQVVSL